MVGENVREVWEGGWTVRRYLDGLGRNVRVWVAQQSNDELTVLTILAAVNAILFIGLSIRALQGTDSERGNHTV